jgi:hypothetical protein
VTTTTAPTTPTARATSTDGSGVEPRRPTPARRTLGILGWVAAVVVGGLLLALAAGRPSPEDYLHPDGTGPQGTRALVEVLRQRGIDVEVVSTADEVLAASGPGTTVVVGNSDLLTSTSARRVLDGTADADRVVLLDAVPALLAGLGLGLHVETPSTDPGTACTARWAHRGDRVDDVSWAVVPERGKLPEGATGCFPVAGEPGTDGRPAAGWAVVDLPATRGRAPVSVVGMPDGATNRFITDADDAGVMVRLLGGSPRLVWFHPTASDLAANPEPEGSAGWPAWLGPGLALLGAAFVVFALARGRRLGRLVPEPLPVVVRAAETTESRAELYRAAADRPRAAVILRRATATRLATRLGLPPGAPADALVPAVAAAAGMPDDEVGRLLVGAPPTDDAALVTLAQQLVHLEEKARRP